MSYIEKEKLIKDDIASIENRVRHAFNQGYDLGFKDGKSKQPNCSEIPTGSTTKNCRTCRNFGSHHGICEICKDNKCWTEQEPTTKNDLGFDLISRNEVLNRLASIAKIKAKSDAQKSLMGRCMFMVERMPSVTPQEPKIVPIAEIKYDKDKLKELMNKAVLTVTPQEPKILALLDKTFDDFCNCPGGESYFHIDGEDYNTDAGYALEGMKIFIKVLKKRLAESEK